MTHYYYRGDDRKLDQLQGVGFQPYIQKYRGRSTTEAVQYIKDLITRENFKSLADIGGYIIASAKGDSVSASCVLDGASYGNNKFKITCQGTPLYFNFNLDGSVGSALQSQGHMYGRKPYYILTNSNISLSDYVIVGTRTNTQEATFFTDIPDGWISLNS